VMFRVNESGSNTYKVEYTPVVPGNNYRVTFIVTKLDMYCQKFTVKYRFFL